MTTRLATARPALLLIAVVAVVMAALLFPIPSHSVLGTNLRNSLHAPGFSLLTGVALLALRKRFNDLRAYYWTAALCVAVGITSEGLQFLGPRDLQVRDIANNILGVAGMLFAFAGIDPRTRSWHRFVRRAVLLAGATLLFVGLRPAAWYSYAFVQRDLAAPRILDFEHRWQKQIYTVYGGARLSLCSAPPQLPAAGTTAASIVSGSALYSGIEVEPFSDWSGYRTLSFVVGAANGPGSTWTLRINDRAHDNRYDDRFNLDIRTGPAPERLRISLDAVRMAPEGRDMDMRAIATLNLFYRGSDEAAQIVLDDMRLEY